MNALQLLLEETGQSHLWQHAQSLAESKCNRFEQDLQRIDWRAVARLFQQTQSSHHCEEDPRVLGQRAQPPERLIRQPDSPVSAGVWHNASQHGADALRSGTVAAILVAGGQGTRLGFPGPKGIFPIGPISGKTLFQLFAEQLLARSRRYGVQIPYLIMTSDATHAETVAFWTEHNHFGLPAADVRFFCQGNMPAVDFEGRALLAGPGQLALSPDGHGGLLAALQASGLLAELRDRGIETLYYHQVDNPMTIVCDPAFIGWHLLEQADVSTKVVAKRSAEEKMGVAVAVDGITRIIEYSDLPIEVASRTDDRGQLRIWAGNTAIHVFQREFLERAATSDAALPFHIAKKTVPYWTPECRRVSPKPADSNVGAEAVSEKPPYTEPSSPNAYKFERFIFDVLPWAQRALIVEANRAAEFNPVKNKEGADSPQTARAGLQALHRSWLRAAGAVIADDVPIEIGPLVALESEDVRSRISPATVFTSAVDWS